MKSLSARLSERFDRILETSLSRMFQHYQKGNPFVVLSACRGDKTDKENKIRTEQLKEEIKKHKFGFSKAWGGYAERQLDGVPKDVLERSVMVISGPERESELRDFSIEMGQKFFQDSILFVNSKGERYLIYTRDVTDENGRILKRVGEDDRDTNIAKQKFHLRRKDSRGFTRVRGGREFTID